VSTTTLPHEQAVRAKLGRILGVEGGTRLFDEVMAELALAEVRSADDVMSFAQQLSRRGGILAAIGSSLTVHAELHGARRV
jgi:hypothetical protein